MRNTEMVKKQQMANKQKAKQGPKCSPMKRPAAAAALQDRDDMSEPAHMMRNQRPLVRNQNPLMRNQRPLMRNQRPLIRNQSPSKRSQSPLMRNQKPAMRSPLNSTSWSSLTTWLRAWTIGCCHRHLARERLVACKFRLAFSRRPA